MNETNESSRPLANLARRHQEALDRAGADIAQANAAVEAIGKHAETARRASERIGFVIGAKGIGAVDTRGIGTIDSTGIGAVSSSMGKIQKLIDTPALRVPQVRAPEFPTYEPYDVDADLARFDAEMEAAGEVAAQEHRETVAREERMVAALEASHEALSGVLQSLQAQNQRAAIEGRWQHAIYAMGVLTLISSTLAGWLSRSWWTGLVGGLVAALISIGILWWADLVRRPWSRS